jgi:hypothetical protein
MMMGARNAETRGGPTHDARSVVESARLAFRPWRQGRKVGRNLYAQVSDDPSDDDIIIGQMDTAGLAAVVVLAHNHTLGYDGDER